MDDPFAVLRSVVFALDPEIPILEEERVTGLVARSTAAERYRATLLTVFAVMAALLAVIGVFGMTTRMVSSRATSLDPVSVLRAE